MILINHIHISEPSLNLIQTRDLHKKLQKIILEEAYDKYVSIEMKKTEDIKEIKDTIKYVKGIFEDDI